MANKIESLIEHSFAVVTGPQRETNQRVLQPILTDLIAFSLTVKQLHWNVIGPNFRPIHLHLDEIHADILGAIDTVAERLTACGHSPVGTLKATLENTELSDVPEGFTKDREVLLLAGHQLQELSGLIRSRMESIEDVDTVTADILHGIVETLEKHHWMIAAQGA
ncbi:MAG: DNA starvation/stationary phase protection protein [Armatimonadetes bacterium]|nr:DNA starvation/stationary phase protection protein [Armatimonadota bacterium]MBS1726430.1 DNA starvation/stationary phase protection protein [Armatimonadota bacterium]